MPDRSSAEMGDARCKRKGNRGPNSVQWTGLLRLLPIVLVLGLAGAAYARDLSNPFFGSDTWPWLVSTRIETASDILRVAFSPIMSGTRFVAEVALFYHPLTALSYSLDQALFGLNPFGFYATNLLIHLAAVGALYTLARGLGASWWAASASALVLALHPIAAATVPSLPRRQDLLVAALLITSMSLLCRARIGETRTLWLASVAAMALFFLALGAKEIAYAGLAVVPFVIACAASRTSSTGPVRAVKTLAQVLTGFLLVEAGAFLVRWRVLGGLGGYLGTSALLGSSQGIVEFFVRPYVTALLWPFQSVMPDRLRDWLLIFALIAIVIGVATAGFRTPRRLLILAGVAWLAAFLCLYAFVHTSLSPYLMYVPLAGLALVAGALLDGAADRLKPAADTHRWPRLTGACAALSAAGSVFLLVGVVRTSAVVVDYPEFRDAGSASQQFIDQAIPCLAAAPDGAMVDVDGLPHRIDFASAESQFIDAYVFEAYSLESMVRLIAPESHARLEARSTQDVKMGPPSVAIVCSQTGDQRQMSVTLR